MLRNKDMKSVRMGKTFLYWGFITKPSTTMAKGFVKRLSQILSRGATPACVAPSLGEWCASVFYALCRTSTYPPSET